MLGLMQEWPLLCHRIIDHAALNHADRPVVSRSVEGDIHTTNYAEIRTRGYCAWRNVWSATASGLATGWQHLPGIPGAISRPGTGLWASARSITPSMTGLFPEQIAWIVNHAEDRMMLLDLTFISLVEKLAAQMPTIERYVVLTDAMHMPATALKNAGSLRGMDRRGRRRFRLENARRNTAAGMCYTSGTTGNPKGGPLLASLQCPAWAHGQRCKT